MTESPEPQPQPDTHEHPHAGGGIDDGIDGGIDDGPPEPALSREAVREMDRVAIEEVHIPSILLMENAGRGAAEFARDLLLERMPTGDAASVTFGAVRRYRHEALAGTGVCVLAGGGNNGGDGFVIARHLHNMGADVFVLLTVPRDTFSPACDAAINLSVCERMGIIIHEVTDAESLRGAEAMVHSANLVVDALFGTGLSRPLEEPFLTAVQLINEAAETQRIVLAVDIPSGLDANTGEVLGDAVRATGTATFGALKTGLIEGAGPDHVGEIAMIEISLPRELIADAYRATTKGR